MKKKIICVILMAIVILVDGCSDIPSNDFNDENVGAGEAFLEEDSAEKENVVEVTFEEDFSIPEYKGFPHAIINNGNPYFTELEKEQREGFENYSELDELGRCGVAFANICSELMPTEERGEIGSIKPSGWKQAKYPEIIGSPGYIWQRCHLIAFCLAGENANEKNLITGTRYFNIEGMYPYESKVVKYVEETGNHVLYRVTPIFEGRELVARGVLIEAYSVEDEGQGICLNVFCFNVTPGIVIDYETGETKIDEDYVASEETETEEAISVTCDYIINKNSLKFHRPDCSSVEKMKEKNKKEYSGTREILINQGYEPCKLCNP